MHIRLASSDQNITYDNDNNTPKYLNIDSVDNDNPEYFNDGVAVDNIIDEYKVWTSQVEAEEGFAQQTNYFAGKNENGEYYTYGDTNPDNLAYHTDAFGEIANDGEKWVTYYQGGKVIDPETQGNDTDVTAITVWLFNRPKEYTAILNTVDPANLAAATYTDDGLLIGNNAVEFTSFYNQRIGHYDDLEADDLVNQATDKYLDAYKISDTDIVKGYDYNTGSMIDFVNMPELVVDETSPNSDPYKFLYWAYDAEGRFPASTAINYAYRITNSVELFAVYGKAEFVDPGLTEFRNGTDYYLNDSGAQKVRLNTMMTPYNCPDNDDTITDVALMYVMLHGSDKYRNYTQEALFAELLKTPEDSDTNYLDVLRQDIADILAGSTSKGSVAVIDATLTANGFKYEVEYSLGNTSKLNLTTKNRIQFTTEFTYSALEGKRMLAFTAMKKEGNWFVSDNYVDYDFLNK